MDIRRRLPTVSRELIPFVEEGWTSRLFPSDVGLALAIPDRRIVNESSDPNAQSRQG